MRCHGAVGVLPDSEPGEPPGRCAAADGVLSVTGGLVPSAGTPPGAGVRPSPTPFFGVAVPSAVFALGGVTGDAGGPAGRSADAGFRVETGLSAAAGCSVDTGRFAGAAADTGGTGADAPGPGTRAGAGGGPASAGPDAPFAGAICGDDGADGWPGAGWTTGLGAAAWASGALFGAVGPAGFVSGAAPADAPGGTGAAVAGRLGAGAAVPFAAGAGGFGVSPVPGTGALPFGPDPCAGACGAGAAAPAVVGRSVPGCWGVLTYDSFGASVATASDSSGSSALRAIASSVSPSPRFINRTPLVWRPALRTCLAAVRITPPPVVMA